MRNTYIYDLPIRIFHWLFSSLFVGAFFIAKTVDDENSLFSYHMLAGVLLAFIVTLRLIWGIFGSKYSRFSSLALRPSDLITYSKEIFTGRKKIWIAHNPASSWAAILMFTFAIGLAVTGYLMSTGHKETFEDAHEVLANGFLATVLLHVSGVAFHMIRHKDGIALSMLDGNKTTPQLTEQGRPHYLISIIFVVLITIFSGYMIQNYNQKEGTLSFFGSQMTLLEVDD